jgi:hypothetical protein
MSAALLEMTLSILKSVRPQSVSEKTIQYALVEHAFSLLRTVETKGHKNVVLSSSFYYHFPLPLLPKTKNNPFMCVLVPESQNS